jgi:hypothetical protein
MPADDAARAQARDSEGTDGPAPGRFRSAFAGTRALMRIAYRDPEHVAERLTLYAAQRLAEPSEEWAKEVRQARADTPPAAIAEELRIQSAQVARVNGAISGTPFLVALVPGYMSYLWQEARMGLRTAALYGHDPGTLQTAAEMLALRGVHPTPETAAEALAAVRDTPMPEEPKERRSLGTWTRSAYQLLVFGGFLDPSDPEEKEAEEERTRLRAAVGLAVTIGIWVSTWVFPLTFMILMAWGCESHTRELGRRLLLFYDGEAATTDAAIAQADRSQDEGHDKRSILRTVAIALSVLIPLGVVAYAGSFGKSEGVNWLTALGGLVALSLVIAVAAIAARR